MKLFLVVFHHKCEDEYYAVEACTDLDDAKLSIVKHHNYTWTEQDNLVWVDDKHAHVRWDPTSELAGTYTICEVEV